MDRIVPTSDSLSDATIRGDRRSKSASFDNVFALLDEDQSRQLVQRVIPIVTYTGTFEVIGRDGGVDPPTELCSPCKELFRRPPPPAERVSDVPRYLGWPSRFWVPHHATLFQLIDCCFSRSGSCRLCQLLWHGIRREALYHRSNKMELQTSDSLSGGLKVALQKRFDKIYLVLNIFPDTAPDFPQGFYVLTYRRHSTSDAVGIIPKISESTDSASTFNQIKRWIHYCQENHKTCHITGASDSARPTRLIRIHQSAGTFQLTTQFSPSTRYAALSYRWGNGKNVYMLTQKTAAEIQEGVPMRLLPKTILDSFTIAHRLGLRYIWADRLCIFQDSREDWSHEASRMAFVYKHAFVTISTSCASDESQGCFRKRNATGIQPLRLNFNALLPSKPANGLRDISYITCKQPDIHQKKGGKLGHLADRGWVLQERILSQRIIHFAEDEVYWECNALEASEGWPDGIGAVSTQTRPSLVHGKESWKTHSRWLQVVEDYSARTLTYERDQLPALSGLAREMEGLRKMPNVEYLAGLWRSTILIDLCWSTHDDKASKPGEYLAPSWSWASLHGKVIYRFPVSKPAFKRVAAFRDARLKFATNDSYGAVDDGWVHLFGYLSPVTVVRRQYIRRPRKRYDIFGDYHLRDLDGNGQSFLDFAAVDLDTETLAVGESMRGPMFCFPLLGVRRAAQNARFFRQPFYCLLLVPQGFSAHIRSRETLESPGTQNQDEFQRAGLARLMVNNRSAFKAWLKETPARDVVIR